MKTSSAGRTASFNAALLVLAVLPVSLATGSMATNALTQGSATARQELEGAVFIFLVLAIPYALLSVAHSALMYGLRHYADRSPRLFIACTWLAVLAVPLSQEFMRSDQRSGHYDLAHLLAIAIYCLLARVPK